jgi:hypothetical protein
MIRKILKKKLEGFEDFILMNQDDKNDCEGEGDFTMLKKYCKENNYDFVSIKTYLVQYNILCDTDLNLALPELKLEKKNNCIHSFAFGGDTKCKHCGITYNEYMEEKKNEGRN